MKNRVLSAVYKYTAIILMLLSAFAIAFPLMRFINGKLFELKDYALLKLEEKTGLTLSYDSLSPAVITGLNFKGIDIIDSETDTVLLHTDSVKISYNLWSLIHGNFAEAIGGVTVTGLDFAFNEQKNMKVAERILSLVQSLPETDKESDGFVMPFPVTLKACSFTVEFRGMSGRLDLESISLKSSSNAPYTTNIETQGSLSFIPDNTLTHIIPKLTTDLKIQAVLTPDMNGTLGKFELKKADGGTFSFNDVEFTAGMNGKQLSLSVYTPDAPYGVEAWWNMETGTLHAELNAEDFNPLTVVTVKKQRDFVKKIDGARIDGRFTVDAKFPDEGGIPEIAYDVDGAVYLPPGILADELNVTLAADGNLSYVHVSDLQVITDAFSFNYYGDADIEQMNLSGYLKLGHYVLPSGKKLEGEFYIDSLTHGFSAFSPQVMLGDAPLTAVQLECVPGTESLDISFEAFDYYHQEADAPGRIQLDGSLLYGDGRFLQASVLLESMYADNLLRYASNALSSQMSFDPSLVEKISPYILSCEGYGSTDFKSFSFNVPYAVVANTGKDDEMLLLSMDGNETNAQISQLELLYAGQQLSATVNADANDDYSQIFFSTEFTFNEMPYSLSGVYDAGNEIVVNGDYDFELRSDLHVKNEILCSLYVDTIPVKIKDYLVSLSLDTDIDFTNLEQFTVTLNRFEVTESSGKFRGEPRLELTGFADRYGLMLETLNYGDSVSILTGDGTVSWNMTKETFDSLAANIHLENPISSEQVLVDLSCFAPEPIPFSKKEMFNELYVSGSVDVESLFMSHFLDHQYQEDTVTVHATALGQLSNPFISLDADTVHMHVNGLPLAASASLMLDDKVLSGNDLNCTFQNIKAQNFGFELSLEEMKGNGTGQFSVDMPQFFTASSPVNFSFTLDESDRDEKNLDLKKAGYDASLVFEDIQSNFEAEIKNYEISVRHDEGMWYLTAGSTGGISGFLLDSGEFYLSALADFPITFTADGSIRNTLLDVQMRDIHGNLSVLKTLFPEQFSIDEGEFEGDLHLGGTVTDPDFDGSLAVKNLVLLMPDYISEPMIAPSATMTADGSLFEAKNVLFNIGIGQALADLTVEMDRWNLYSIDVSVVSANNTLVPARFNIDYADCTADADVNLNVNLTGKDISITGSVNTYNGLVELHTGGGAVPETVDTGGRVYIDLSLSISQKAELYYPDKDNPLIRGLVTTQEPVRLIMDSDTAEISVKGKLVLRGGEILYLNRNFYLREGMLDLDESGDDFDPRISFRAEIRERDAEGELVKISLSADRQKLSQLSPVLSSEPSKTEDEIRMMLGAALIAESGSTPGEVLANVAASGFDFLLQNSLFRQLENRLRDLLHFDIFSFRTPFIQQALLSAMNNSEEPTSLGNFFDNTTVYIGKYIGNTIYLDAMLRFVYQENNSGGGLSSRLAFQPEVGLELPSPFATIRWSIAPDITSAKNLWVPYTSISLSWSFKF